MAAPLNLNLPVRYQSPGSKASKWHVSIVNVNVGFLSCYVSKWLLWKWPSGTLVLMRNFKCFKMCLLCSAPLYYSPFSLQFFRWVPRWSAAQPNTRLCLFNNKDQPSVNSYTRAGLTKHDTDRHTDLTDILKQTSSPLFTNPWPQKLHSQCVQERLDTVVNHRKQYREQLLNKINPMGNLMWISCILSQEST